MSKRRRIALDIDGVLYAWSKTARFLLRTERGYDDPDGPLTQESTHWNYIFEHVTKEDADWLWSAGVEQFGLFRHGDLVNGAIDGVRDLSKVGDIILVSHRPENAIRDTVAFLDYHFGDFSPYPFVGVNILTHEEPKTDLQWDILIDDKIDNVMDALEAGRQGVLFNQPWNQGGVADLFGSRFILEVDRAFGWQDVAGTVEFLLEIS